MIKKPQNKKKKKEEKNPIGISCYAWCKQHLVFFVIILFFLNKYIPIYIALLIMENGLCYFNQSS